MGIQNICQKTYKMTGDKITLTSIVSGGVNICKKLSELPKTGKEILIAAGIGATLYGATHLNAAGSTEPDVTYYSTPAITTRYVTNPAPHTPSPTPTIPSPSRATSPASSSVGPTTSSTIARTSRNIVMPVTRNGINVGTLDYVVQENGRTITDDSRLYFSSENNPDERWIPFIENGKIKGHYVGTNEDLTFRMNGKEGIYADEDHQVLRNGTDDSDNSLWYALGGALGTAAILYGLSKIRRRRRRRE
tara:strand:+ start:6269 stop:7012 length:744 start_codon:yes stop_codon:yes gene_type:complete